MTVDDATTRPDPPAMMKQVNRLFVTGVTVVTALDDGTPRGLAVNAFASISLEPPMAMVAVQHTSSTHDCLYRADHLAVNILSTDQLDVVNRFAVKSDDKFAGLDWRPGPPHGSPLIGRSAATMEPRSANGCTPAPTRSSCAGWCTPRWRIAPRWSTAPASSSMGAIWLP